jgi:hypothetical protein
MAFSTLGTGAISWVDLTVTIIPRNGSAIEDIDLTELSWNSTKTREVQRKKGRKYARTTGSIDHSASMSLYMSGWRALRAELIVQAEASGFGGAQVAIGNIAFDVIAKRKALESDEFEVLKLKDCMIDDLGESWSEGDEPHSVTFALNPMQAVMVVDGKEVALG